MFKTKFRKVAFFSVFALSLIANAILIMGINNVYDTRNEIADCAKSSQEASKSKVGDSAKKATFERVYEECLKARYGIDPRSE